MSEMILWSPGTTLDQIEKQVILKAYAHYKTRTTTAQALGISVRTLDGRLDRYREEDEAQKKKDEERARQQQIQLLRARGNPPNNVGIPYSPYVQPEPLLTAEAPDPFTAAERPTKTKK